MILGSQALGDGTFDRDTDFTAFVEDGSWSVPLSSILNSTGDVLYVVPAAKSEYPADEKASAGYCCLSLPALGCSTSSSVRTRQLTFAWCAGESYQALTGSTRKSAGYCYDTNTLLPQYNPLAVAIPSDANSSVSSVVVSPLSTVLVFGTAYGEPASVCCGRRCKSSCRTSSATPPVACPASTAAGQHYTDSWLT